MTSADAKGRRGNGTFGRGMGLFMVSSLADDFELGGLEDHLPDTGDRDARGAVRVGLDHDATVTAVDLRMDPDHDLDDGVALKGLGLGVVRVHSVSPSLRARQCARSNTIIPSPVSEVHR